MKKLMFPLLVSGLLMAGCTVETVSYGPGYSRDYVTVGYYSYRPYWDNYYYNGYGVRNYGYWGSYDYYDGY
jgi:hypothetical protein